MHSPIPHDLRNYDKNGFGFEKFGFCPHQWEISVPQKNCINWGVVLSYLRSADYTTPGKFEQRLNWLTESTFDPELVKSAISNFNPFFNIHKCFFDETLKKIMLSFKKLLGRNRPSSASKSVRLDIELISTVLQSNILIVDLIERSLHLVEPKNGQCPDLATITLVCREYLNKESKNHISMKRFTFALDKDLCWEFRINALQIFLESHDTRGMVERELQSFTEKKEKKVNLLIALLKKNYIREISELYDSSYTMSKLAGAGFETDPRVLAADGHSAFYYALQSNDKNLVYILYRYAANSCYEFENTFRDPNPCIISNFSKLKEILDGDSANNFDAFGDGAKQATLSCDDLKMFNEFLTRVSQGINEIRKRPENSDLEKAVKQKDVILHILEMYETFFSVGRLDTEEEIENYTNHKTYYDNLDFTVALLFFDNIFLLKSILKSPEERLYSKLESSFLLLAVTNKYFTPGTETNKEYKDLGVEISFANFSIIPFLERRNLREKVNHFCSTLREKKTIEEDVVKCIASQEIREMLSDFPELKDEFVMYRINHYMKTALKVATKGMKQKLVIQRALQVIGESINVEEEDPSSIRHTLRRCLPGGVLEVLKKTRNTLSHLKSFQFPNKFEAEQDDFLFESIQSEIQNIKDRFDETFDLQRIRLLEFLINRGLESVQKFQQVADVTLQSLVQDRENLGECMRKKSSEFKLTSNQKAAFRHHGINAFGRRLMGFASDAQQRKIRGEIPSEITDRVDAIKKLEKDLKDGVSINSKRLDCLFVESKDIYCYEKVCESYSEMEMESETNARKRKLKYLLLRKIRNSPNPLIILDRILDQKKVSDSELQFLFKVIEFSEKSKSALNLLIEISKDPCGDSLSNLLNRVKHLFQISIDEAYDIRFLWERVKSSEARQYLVYKIVQRYFRESSFQASLEMLLFDCINILKNQEDFKSFCIKDSYLYNGIDVRNVLAHGDPLLESIGGLLDPKDLPSDLVKKMLQLFEDRECMEALCCLWQKAKKSGYILENCSECLKFKERIVRCKRWEEYSKLLLEYPNCSDIFDVTVSFVKRVPDSKKKKNLKK